MAAPLLPRHYLRRDPPCLAAWRSIQSAIGEVRLVCNDEDPAAVADGAVDGLRRRENHGFVPVDQRPDLAPGAPVWVLHGVFRLTDGKRVAIHLDLLGRKVRAVLDDLSVAAT
jgi:hypothetical protein